ncbi:energy-coupling factor transporter transmembrane protein EcfT [Vibrio sp. JC009]|uniref:energy-coupling factor transporter transmembrane component T family protein n=1 Tax=Vibrio sp. JC009 TaxID=2912314 RepID=UPI0023B00064|nr:energy-coupling factor transporter transmembrane component T [Vibrio sp. JC009]WED22837.1 energy-coupling factor transporter transmembrane protein EcfT [Vibrio sp. JC009]
MIEGVLSGNVKAGSAEYGLAHTRILLAIFMIVAIVLSANPLSFAGYFILACLLWLKSPMGFATGLKRLLIIDSVVLLTILPLPFNYVGDQVIHWGPLVLSEPGVVKAQEIFFKASLSAMLMMTQCSGISGLELTKALCVLRVPTKFILLLQFSIRYISVMQQEIASIRSGMKARGLGCGPRLHVWRSYGYMFGMLLVRALARADRIWLAMKCRGYSGHFPVSKGEQSQLFDRSAMLFLFLTLVVFSMDILAVWPVR